MPALPYTAAAIVIAGVASSAALALSTDRASPAVLVCELHLSQLGQQVTLRAEAAAPVALSGTYKLDIAQHSASGVANVQQSGDFSLQPGQRVRLTEAQFQGRAQDLSARMTLWAGGQSQTCSTLSL